MPLDDPPKIDARQILPSHAEGYFKLEDEVTRQANLARKAKTDEWNLQREKVLFFTAVIFILLTAVASMTVVFIYSDAAGRKTAAFTILSSIK
jgi:hypothetical protein